MWYQRHERDQHLPYLEGMERRRSEVVFYLFPDIVLLGEVRSFMGLGRSQLSGARTTGSACSFGLFEAGSPNQRLWLRLRTHEQQPGQLQPSESYGQPQHMAWRYRLTIALKTSSSSPPAMVLKCPHSSQASNSICNEPLVKWCRVKWPEGILEREMSWAEQ